VDVDEEDDDEDDDKDGDSVVSRRLDVVLVAPGTDRLAVIKLLKNELGMGVADAKAVIDSAPTVIKQGLVSHLANDLVSKFTAVGAKMKVQ
jgi:large subunit ribosomal protein L7/L12